jgi:uncharacterized OsmC-like protein
MTDPIKAALREGSAAINRGTDIAITPAEFAIGVAACLRAAHAAPGEHREWTWRELAAAVERAARESDR